MSRNHLKLVDGPPSRAEWHEFGCRCETCEPYAPSVPAQLSWTAIGKLCVAGIATGLVIIFAIDPTGAAAALYATIGL